MYGPHPIRVRGSLHGSPCAIWYKLCGLLIYAPYSIFLIYNFCPISGWRSKWQQRLASKLFSEASGNNTWDDDKGWLFVAATPVQHLWARTLTLWLCPPAVLRGTCCAKSAYVRPLLFTARRVSATYLRAHQLTSSELNAQAGDSKTYHQHVHNVPLVQLCPTTG